MVLTVIKAGFVVLTVIKAVLVVLTVIKAVLVVAVYTLTVRFYSTLLAPISRFLTLSSGLVCH